MIFEQGTNQGTIASDFESMRASIHTELEQYVAEIEKRNPSADLEPFRQCSKEVVHQLDCLEETVLKLFDLSERALK